WQNVVTCSFQVTSSAKSQFGYTARDRTRLGSTGGPSDVAEWWRGCRLARRLLRAVLLLAAAHSACRGRTRTRVRPRVAACRWGCGNAGDHLHSDRPTGPIGPADHPDGADWRRRTGLIDYGAAVGCVHTDATGISR